MSDVKMPQENLYLLEENPGKRITTLTAQIVAEFEGGKGSVAQARAVCTELAEFLRSAPVFPERPQLEQLVAIVNKGTEAMVEPLFDLLVQLSARIDDPWVVLKGMLGVRDEALLKRALERTLRLVQIGKLLVDLDVLQFLAETVERQGSPLGAPDHLQILAKIVHLAAVPQQDLLQDPINWLRMSSNQPQLRRLAERILEAEAEQA